MSLIRRHFKTFNKNDIASWQSDLKNIPGEIETLKNNIITNEDALKILNPILDELTKQKYDPTRNSIDALKAQIKVLTLPDTIESTKNKIPPHKNTLAQLEEQLKTVNKILEPINTEMSIIQTCIKARTEIEDCRSSISDLKHKILYHDGSISSLQLKVKSLQTDLTTLTSELSLTTSELSAKETELSSLKLQLEMQRRLHIQPQVHSTSGYRASISSGIGYQAPEFVASVGIGYQAPNSAASAPGIGYQAPEVNSSAGIGYQAPDFVSQIDFYPQEKRILELKQQVDQLTSNKKNIRSNIKKTTSNIHKTESDISGHHGNSLNYKQDILTAESKIERLSASISKYSYPTDIDMLKLKLKQQLEIKSPHEKNQLDLIKKIDSENRELKSLHSLVKELENDFKHCKIIAAPFADNTDLSNLEAQLIAQSSIFLQLQNEKDQINKKIKTHEDKIRNDRYQIRELTSRYKDHQSNDFLFTLENNPQHLADQLINNLSKALFDFDNSHIIHLSENARITLAELQKNMLFIFNQNMIHVDTNEIWRMKYYQLCGLLWNHLNKVDNKNDSNLADELHNILIRHPLDEIEAKTEYVKLQQLHQYYAFTMSTNELSQHEQQNYIQACQQFNQAHIAISSTDSKEIGALRDTAKNVVDLVNEKKMAAEKSGTSFDMRFNTKIIAKTTQLMMDPANHKLRNEYKAIMDHNQDGNPSTKKKVLGAMLIFFGAALAAISVAAQFLSFGISSGLSIAGMAVGGAMIVSGIGLFAHGRQNGLAKQMADFDASTKNSSATFFKQQVSNAGYQANGWESVLTPSAPPL